MDHSRSRPSEMVVQTDFLPPQHIFDTDSLLGGYLKVVSTPKKGRCFVATKDIPPGQVVLRCRPYVCIPDSMAKHAICVVCMKPNSNLDPQQSSLKYCQDCRQVSYCNAECQRKDEIYHDLECSFFKQFWDSGRAQKLESYTLDYMWLLMRVLIRRRYELMFEVGEASNQTTNERKLPNCSGLSDGLTFDDVWRMCSNAESFSPEKRAEFDFVASVLYEFVQTFPGHEEWNDLFCSLPTLKELICKEECNSFGLYHFLNKDLPRQPYGLALYPLAVYFNHSCNPNIIHTTVGRDEIFYSAEPIRNGEELTITYISLRDSKEKRQKELFEVFHFHCDCKRCCGAHQEEESVNNKLCSRSDCYGIYLPDQRDSCGKIEWKCSACNKARQ